MKYIKAFIGILLAMGIIINLLDTLLLDSKFIPLRIVNQKYFYKELMKLSIGGETQEINKRVETYFLEYKWIFYTPQLIEAPKNEEK